MSVSLDDELVLAPFTDENIWLLVLNPTLETDCWGGSYSRRSSWIRLFKWNCSFFAKALISEATYLLKRSSLDLSYDHKRVISLMTASGVCIRLNCCDSNDLKIKRNIILIGFSSLDLDFLFWNALHLLFIIYLEMRIKSTDLWHIDFWTFGACTKRGLVLVADRVTWCLMFNFLAASASTFRPIQERTWL